MKTLKKFASLHHLVVDVNRQAVYGRYRGYNVVVSNLANQKNYMIQLSVVHENEVVSEEAKQYIWGLVSHYDFVHYASYASPNLTVSVKKKGNAGTNLDMILDLIIRYLGMNGFLNACQSCKQTTQEVGIYSVQGKIYMLCSECFNRIVASLNERQTQLPKENVGLGVLGVFLGSLVGVLVWMVLYRIGIIAAFSASIMFILGIKGYEKFGRIFSKKGLIITVVMCVLMIFLAEYLSLALEIYIQLSEYYILNIFDAISLVPSIVLENDILSYVIKDIMFGYLFLVLTSASSIKNLGKQLNQQNEVSRLI